jgi:hypothetical protein
LAPASASSLIGVARLHGSSINATHNQRSPFGVQNGRQQRERPRAAIHLSISQHLSPLRRSRRRFGQWGRISTHSAGRTGRDRRRQRRLPAARLRWVYAWWFRRIPPLVPSARCVTQDGSTLLYVGISPKAPPRNGAPSSRQTLCTRIRYHMRGNAEGSTLRLTLGCLLAAELGIEPRRVGSGFRMTFAAGEAVLSEWMAENALVCWSACAEPWVSEEKLIRSVSLPLNLDQISSIRFTRRLPESGVTRAPALGPCRLSERSAEPFPPLRRQWGPSHPRVTKSGRPPSPSARTPVALPGSRPPIPRLFRGPGARRQSGRRMSNSDLPISQGARRRVAVHPL